MLTRFNSLIALTCLIAGTLWAADDPFAGKWKLDQEKSKITGEQMKIEDLGDNKYQFTIGETSDTITADGTDQPVHDGQSMAITKDGSDTWKIITKKNGKTIASGTETVSDDGKTLTVKGTNFKPDGSTSDFGIVYKRIGSGSGFAGKWESTNLTINSPVEWDIEPYEGNGLTFNTPAYQETLSMKFDGKDYTEKGPDVAPGSTSSGKRLNAHTIEVTDKLRVR